MFVRPVSLPKFFISAGIALLVMLGGYLTWVAVTLRVDLFDSYAIYLNARQIAEARPILYYWKASPLLSLMYAPYFLAEQYWGWTGSAVLMARLTSVAFYLLWILAAYKLLCVFQDRLRAFAGAVVMGLNPLAIHYAPFPKEDLPGAGFVALSFFFYVSFRGKGDKRELVRAALCAGAAMALRPQYMFLIPCVVLLYETGIRFLGPEAVGGRIGSAARGWLWSFFFFFFLPLLVPVALATGIYAFLGIDTWGHAPVRFLSEIFRHVKILSSHRETYWEAYAFLVRACGWPMTLLAMFGMGVTAVRKDRSGLFCMLWFLAFFLFQAHVIRHIEARFFFGSYIPFYVFAAIGFWRAFALLSAATSPLKRVRRPALFVFCAVVIGSAVRPAFAECRKFRDPFYRDGFVQRVADEAGRLADRGQVFWYGDMYPLHPKEFVFHPEDEATYLYHVYNHTLSFFLRRRVPVYVPTDGFVAVPEGYPVFAGGASSVLQDGDVMVVGLVGNGDTKNVPARVPPLLIQRVRKMRFVPVGLEGECVILSAGSDLAAQGMSLCSEAGRYHVRGWGLPDRYMELYILLKGKADFYPLLAGRTKPVGGAFFQRVDLPPGIALPPLSQTEILYYDAVRLAAPLT